MSSVTIPAPPWTPTSVVPQPRKWTATEFDHLGELGCFEGRRAYLLDGVIWEQGPMDPPHADALEVLTELVRAAFGTGWRMRGQLPLHIDQDNNPMPDLAVVAGKAGFHGIHPTMAALVVEVADTTLQIDITAKAGRYATGGIADYWVLDLKGRTLLVFRNPAPIPDGGAAYRDQRILTATDSISPLAAPNSTIRVADLLP